MKIMGSYTLDTRTSIKALGGRWGNILCWIDSKPTGIIDGLFLIIILVWNYKVCSLWSVGKMMFFKFNLYIISLIQLLA